MPIRAARWPLSRKIFLLALLNLAAIGAVLAIFAQWQFGLSLESLVLGPARDRLIAVANAAARDLQGEPFSSRPQILDDYSQRYGANFYLLNPRGDSMGGPDVDLPPAVLDRMRVRPPLNGRHEDPRPSDWQDPGPDGGGGPPNFPPPGAPGRGGRGFGAPGAAPADRAFLVVTRHPLLWWVGVRIPTTGPQGEQGVPGVLLIRATSIFNSRLFFDWRSLLWLAAILIAVGLACWWPFLHRVAESIRQMDRATEEIAHGRFERHVTIRRDDELGHLGDQINQMAVRLEGFVKHQKRFLGDIAHELCAPIARIQFALGILEQKIDSQQQTHLAVLHDEIQEMSALVNELLMFSKAGIDRLETPLAPIELAPAVQRAIAHQMPGSGTIDTSIPAALIVSAHEPYLVRAVSNLLRNALRYAGEDGPILISARCEGKRVLLSVADSGPGLPEGSHEDVFAPFYRPETARTRETGGAGLGLAIVKSCIEACRGTVTCRNREHAGLEVIISLQAPE